MLEHIVMYIDVMHRGGAQRVMVNLAEYFCAKGAKITLVNDFLPNESAAEYSLPANVRRLYLRDSLGRGKFVKNIERVRRLRKIVETEKPDLVLSFLGGPNVRMLIATVGLPCKKIVSVRNDPNAEYGKSWHKKQFVRKLFEVADGCVFQTKDAAQYFGDKVKAKSTIIKNPVAQKFYDIDRSDLPQNIITVGRLEPQKNQRLLIDAFAQIADLFPNENLIIYGTGSLEAKLKRHVVDLHLQGRVLFAGDEKSIEEKLAESKIFVLSSDFEGMPNALMEAMAVGMPSISTDCPCGGPREVIANNIDGILVPCGDVKVLADAMNKLLANRGAAECMGIKAKRNAAAFRTEKICMEWEEYFLQVLCKK